MTLTLTHRRYVDYSRAHYAGHLVDGAYVLGLFGDIATDVCLQHDGDEGLFAGYSRVTFHQPVRAGDVVEVTAAVTRVGNRSRDIDFTARVVTRSAGEGSTRGRVLPEPILAVSAVGTVVVPAEDAP
ncbi:hotdog domain-containing protein [Mycolicibacterium sp.]|uniref:3-aminobutyryl-CoA ammonia lyase n=1 Tax=Mycolicibacterium sp. TaxID=2320850 RepID=UPI003D0EF31B